MQIVMSDSAPSDERKPFIVHCGNCNHEWAAFYAPLPLTLAAKIGKSVLCPMCGEKKRVLCGPAPQLRAMD